jgi:hypothetical protein
MVLRSGSAPVLVKLAVGAVEIAMQVAPLLIGQPAVAIVAAAAIRWRTKITLRLALKAIRLMPLHLHLKRALAPAIGRRGR